MARGKLQISKDLGLPLDWITLATVVYGARGSGKTSLGRVFAEEATKVGQRFCAIDLKGDWYGLKSSADGKRDGIPVVVFGGDHQDVPLEDGAGKFVGETVAKLEQSCILDLEYFSKGKQVRFLTEFFLSLYDTNREPLLLLMDEAQRYAPQSRMPDPESAKCLGAVEDLVKLGRKHGIGPVLFTQRGSGLNKEVSELCDLLVAFRTPGPLDQDRVKDWLDANTTRVQRDQVMGQLSGLATGTAVFASGHPDLKVFGVHAVRLPETFDSSATPKVGQRRIEPKKLAKPDLEDLRAKMAEAIERATADDPKALRAKVKALEAELAKARSAKVATAKPGKTIKTTETIREVEAVVVPDVDAFERIRSAVRSGLEEVGSLLDGYIVKFDTELQAEVRRGKQALVAIKRQKPVRTKETAEAISAAPPAQQQPQPVAAPSPVRRGAKLEGFGPGEGEVLRWLIQRPNGVSREALTVLTGYATSTRNAYLQRLAAAGLCEPGGVGVVATDAGRAALPDAAPLPTGEALQEWWLSRLPDGEARVLRLLLDASPDGLTREAISEATAFALSTRNAYLQRLGQKGLLGAPNGSQLVAHEELF